MRMPFGKYENWEIPNIPIDYHIWLWTFVPLGDPELREAVRREILASGMHGEIPRTAVNGTIRPSSASYAYYQPPPPPPPQTPPRSGAAKEKQQEQEAEEKRKETAYRWVNGVPPQYKEVVQKIVEKGYRQVAMTQHPDRGGSIEQFNHLQEVMVWLRKQIK